MRILISLLLTGLSLTATADDVYRWTDSSGVIHYSDKPQAPSDKPVALPSLQTYSHAGTPPGFTPVPQSGAAAAAPVVAVSIVSPAPDETIRDAEGKFTVTVNAGSDGTPALIYYLDGAAENAQPTASTALLYSGVDRGDHSIAVALVDASGHELARSPAVTIHMMPPQAKHH